MRVALERVLPFNRVLVAGLMGGLAEVLWVLGYCAMTPLDGLVVAREITQTLFPLSGLSAMAPVMGLVIHLLLSVLLALVYAWSVYLVLGKHKSTVTIMLSAVVALTMVWSINFLMVLPVLNAEFVTLMPYAVTLFSKVLFGFAMGFFLILPSHHVSQRPVIESAA